MKLPHEPHVEFAGRTDIGSVREENQDTIRLPDDSVPEGRGLLLALADGMGGLAHGKLASSIAVDALFEAYYGDKAPVPRSIGRGVESANSKVFGAAQGERASRMGTTLTAAVVRDAELWIAHVGDSRAYLVRDGKAVTLTNDHTTVGDLVRMKLLSPDKVRAHAQRSMLNRAVGLGLFVKPDVTRTRLLNGDRVLICSDGVWSVIEDEEIGAIVSSAKVVDELCESLIATAIERGSDDNVSAIAIKIDLEEPPEPRAKEIGKARAFLARAASALRGSASAAIDNPRKERA
jgi:serine/threonine protein phosphatase PrpC